MKYLNEWLRIFCWTSKKVITSTSQLNRRKPIKRCKNTKACQQLMKITFILDDWFNKLMAWNDQLILILVIHEYALIPIMIFTRFSDCPLLLFNNAPGVFGVTNHKFEMGDVIYQISGSQIDVTLSRSPFNNLRYADDTVLAAES